MKKNYTTEAINLKNYPLNDNDSIVVMFSKTKGLIKAVAKGAKRPKSKLGARIQMFIANKLMLSEGRNLDTIAEAQSLNTFSKIRYDLDKMSYSMYIAELVNTFCSKEFQNSESGEIYDLIFNTYNKIQNAPDKKEVLFSILKFQIHFIKLLGWGLDFNYCSFCQKELSEENICFSFQAGGFLCSDCSKTNVSDLKIHNKIREFLNEISSLEFSQKTKYDELVAQNPLMENFIEKCFLFMKKYIDNISHKKTKIFEVLEKTTAMVR